MVTNVDGAFATICDGKHRPVERQKKKKLIHLAVTTVIVTMSSNQTNREIKKLLRQFKENKNMIS
ncbi:MAG TPA: hypothetical protein GX401_07325 [Clostridiales bacterium]|nr:hypothetical protein [Clostridiales bacterium]